MRFFNGRLGLRVRLTASRERCVARVAGRESLSIDEARARVDRLEQDRAEFVRKHFHVDANDAYTFDLVITLDRFSPADAVELILHAMKLRGIVV
jgi:cytidylate kinase